MDFDVQGHLDAVNRSVSSLERGGQPAREVTLSRTYPTIVEDLWDAVTNSQRIPRWFLPISGKLEPGGRYQLEGNAGGVITACERPAHLALTWEFGEDVSWVELRLSVDRAGGARLTLTHTAHLSDGTPFGTLGRLRDRRRSPPERTQSLRVQRRGAQPRSTLENRPSPPDAPTMARSSTPSVRLWNRPPARATTA